MKTYLKYLIILLVFIIFYSCTESIPDNPLGNKPPETGLFLFPDSSISQQPSRLAVHWWGDDPDGLIIGFYYSWDGINWTFTKENSILFELKIGATNKNFKFRVSAVDNSGNGTYDNKIIQNNIDYGSEPFTDSNGNGKYDNGEEFVDIGSIDPTPATLDFPIKNSAPTLKESILSILPDTSFPVMSFAWDANDIDGNETIQNINIVLNDTTDTQNFISLNGAVRIITLRTKDFNSPNPEMEIMIDGLETNIFSEKLKGLKLNDNNRLYVQAVDISGAKSKFISLPDTSKTWFVKKPKGDLLIVDDYTTPDNAADFYNLMMDSLGLKNKFSVYDFRNQLPPFLNVTFVETLKLFKYVFWYTDNNPSLDLASVSTRKYIDAGGKIAFSMQFPQSIDLNLIQGFLPIISDSADARSSLIGGTKVISDTTKPEYPNLQTSSSLFRVKSFYLSRLAAIPIYYFANNELKGFTGFTDTEKKLFFIALPLHKSNGGQANVKKLLNKIFIEDFGLIP